MKRTTFLSLSAALFLFLTAEQSAAKAGALWGCELWLRLLVPSLLPFFAAAGLLSRSGLPEMLEKRCGAWTERLFRLPGSAAAPLILGLTGGYPLGAASAAELWKTGQLTKEEAERLLFFCDNTGPAFAVAALGGALGSPGAGLLLYGVHALSALMLGFLFRGGAARSTESRRQGGRNAHRKEFLCSRCRREADPRQQETKRGGISGDPAGTGGKINYVNFFPSGKDPASRRGLPLPTRQKDAQPSKAPEGSFAAALTASVTAAGLSLLRVGAFVVFFSALLYALDAAGVLREAALRLSLAAGCEIGRCRALIWSIFELSGTVGLLEGMPLCPESAALAAFALSWGGLCVHCQSAAVTEGLSGKRRLAGKLLHGLLSAGLAYVMLTVWRG